MRYRLLLILIGLIATSVEAATSSKSKENITLDMSQEQALCQQQLLLPDADKDGRRKTLNHFGFADTVFSETQLKFKERALERAKSRTPGDLTRQKIALEIGTAYGDLGLEIVQGGGFYLGMDREPKHVQIAKERLDAAEFQSSQSDVITGTFPLDSTEQAELRSWLLHTGFEIGDIGMFSVGMYMNPQELLRFFRWAYSVLPSGGNLFITGISPYSNLYPGYEPTYMARKNNRNELFPGWIPDVKIPEMKPFIPDLKTYLEKYPEYFHLLDTDVLHFLGAQANFTNIEVKYLRRLFPEGLIYQGEAPNVGELASFVATKP